MALEKQIVLTNGVVINYHRVVSLNIITNWANIIEVCGYTSKEKRQEEKDAFGKDVPIDVYMETEYISIPYDQTMNIDLAYEYLKTTEKYKDATDVLEDETGLTSE